MAYKSVLLVDDYPEFLDALEYGMNDMGIKPDLARSREEAIEMAKEKSYELCVSDGLEGEWILLCDEMRSLNPGIRFILLSGDCEQIYIARESNMEAYGKDDVKGLLNSIK